MRTATFFEALASAAARPGEKWRKVDGDYDEVFMFFYGTLCDRSGYRFWVRPEYLAANWVCEGEGGE